MARGETRNAIYDLLPEPPMPEKAISQALKRKGMSLETSVYNDLHRMEKAGEAVLILDDNGKQTWVRGRKKPRKSN